ncbi:uncharacterized protein LOC114298405 [Camellia sinensis]|uniref:uncharacterized protein LOC114298405 n=1 Tax=Camellia sinensis TaxID=4442 RepID=UPI0010367C93|nr:uncharacterized protein LOC114298405 [Camellia sinensis]
MRPFMKPLFFNLSAKCNSNFAHISLSLSVTKKTEEINRLFLKLEYAHISLSLSQSLYAHISSSKLQLHLRFRRFRAISKRFRRFRSISRFRAISKLHRHRHLHRRVGTKFPVSQVEEWQVRAYREIERQDMNKLLHEYRMFCDRAGVRTDVLHIERDSVEKGIVELVSQHQIRRLVMGAAAHKHYSKYKPHRDI